MVHGDRQMLRLVAFLSHDVGLIVHDGIGAGIVVNLEIGEGQGERKIGCCPMLVQIARHTGSLLQMDGAIMGKEMGDEGAQEDEQQGEVEQQHGHALMQPGFNNVMHGQEGKQHP